VGVPRDNIDRIVLDTMSDLVGNVERRPIKTRVTKQMINKMNLKESNGMQ
jgi:hypothetical protein